MKKVTNVLVELLKGIEEAYIKATNKTITSKEFAQVAGANLNGIYKELDINFNILKVTRAKAEELEFGKLEDIIADGDEVVFTIDNLERELYNRDLKCARFIANHLDKKREELNYKLIVLNNILNNK